MLFGVEEGIEVIAWREVALRRARLQGLILLVADRAGLQRFSGELRDVTFDAGLVRGELQAQLSIAIGRGHQASHRFARVVAIVTLQFARLQRSRDLDHPRMRLVREFLIVDSRLLLARRTEG